jgi:ribosome recycling factor
VKVPIPKPSAETREASLKNVGKIHEATKARIRRTRQAALDNLKKSGAANVPLAVAIV